MSIATSTLSAVAVLWTVFAAKSLKDERPEYGLVYAVIAIAFALIAIAHREDNKP